MKRPIERLARHSSVAAIVFGLVLAFAGVAVAQVVSGTPQEHGGPTTSTAASTTGGTSTNANKVLICHFTKSKKHPAHTISVAKAAEQSFLARGDREGKCTDAELHPATTTASTTTSTTNSTKPSKHKSKPHRTSKPKQGDAGSDSAGKSHGGGKGK
jgi:hypothetical protein